MARKRKPRNYHRPPAIITAIREMCYSCFRPSSHCVCGFIAPFEAHCNVLILQHPHERKKYYSTAKLVMKALVNSTLLRGVEFSEEEISKPLVGQKPYLLFPDANAVDCSELSLSRSDTVIVIDGTWSEAGKIIRLNPKLKTFPTLSFRDPLRSNYRIRKQPKENYLSTIESIGHLLKINSKVSGIPPERYDPLFEGFSKMVEQQLSYWPKRREPTDVNILQDRESTFR